MENIEEAAAKEWKLLADRDVDFIKKIYISTYKYALWKAQPLNLKIDAEDLTSEVILGISEENLYNTNNHHITVTDFIKRRVDKLLFNHFYSRIHRLTVPFEEYGLLENYNKIDLKLSEEAYLEKESAEDERQDRIDIVKSAFQSLKPLEVKVVELLYIMGLDEAEVADILQISVNDVRLKKKEAFLKLNENIS